jgi:hypothetical protein
MAISTRFLSTRAAALARARAVRRGQRLDAGPA